MSISLPPNLKKVLTELMKLASLDFFFVEMMNENIFNFTPTDAFNDNAEVAGYETSNFIENLGSSFYIFIFALLFSIFLLIVNPKYKPSDEFSIKS